jgi:hypothetical protein
MLEAPVSGLVMPQVSFVIEVFVVVRRQRCIGAADGRLGIPRSNSADHPEGALEIVARVTHTRSLNPPNQHDTRSIIRQT